MAGIYIHVPFCKSKCSYCDFASYPSEINKKELYFGCLYKEIKSKAIVFKDKIINTIYFGGGTPSFVEAKYIVGAINQIKKYYKLSDNIEVSLEVNPGTISEEKYKIYKRAGINRFSIGLQSSDDKMLHRLSRIHNFSDFEKTVKILEGNSLSVDIMIGLFNQTNDDLKNTIDKILKYKDIKHISMYALKAEDGTPMYTHYLNGELPSDDETADLYDFGRNYLKKFGFERYEVSNFAIPGFESRHNLNYWERGEYIGFGVSASSFYNETRFTNTYKIDEYVHCILTNHAATISTDNIEGNERKFEYLMLFLRTKYGINLKHYKEYFSSDFFDDFGDKFNNLKKYFEITDEKIKIKDEYLFVQNNILIYFME